jgi:DNA-binding NtrC family response regulator
MTSALIGKEGALRAHVRVGLVSKGGMARLAEAVSRVGHDATEWTDWQALVAGAGHAPVDLVSIRQMPVVVVDDPDDLIGAALAPMLALAGELRAARSRCEELEHVVDGIRSGTAMVGKTPALRRLQAAVSRAADCDATVLIEGPKGSGKSLAARMIHLKSRRSSQPLIARDCETLSAEELQQAIADGAETTLILEDVDRLPAPAQSALVKHLKERSTSRTQTHVRLVATTSAHVPELVARGAFREDLFYRLHSLPVLVPGLHERTDDVVAIAESILEAGVAASGRNHQGLTPSARMLLESMTWPGNVAQLETTLRRSQVLAGGAMIDRDHLVGPSAPGASAQPVPLKPAERIEDESELTEDAIRPFEEEEKFLLGRALQATKGNVRRAAQLLGIGRATLYRKIQQYRLRLH